MSTKADTALINAQGEREISLHYYFDGYEKAFVKILAKAASDFFARKVDFKLVRLSYTPDSGGQDGDFFVSQLNITAEHTVTIKTSDTAANCILKSLLGNKPKESEYLKLKDITEFEAKVLTGLNEILLKKTEGNFLTFAETKNIENKTPDPEKAVYLTFYMYGNDDYEAGKIVFIFPEFIMKNLKPLKATETPLTTEYFNSCLVETNIIAGYSRLALDDIKNLDVEDIVILEKSNVYSMILKNHGNLNINVNPNPAIAINVDEENGEATVNKKTETIWDSLEVDLSAEFDKIKIRLGDLRQIVEGLVIDVAPIAQNTVYLNVEDKRIAAGELVIAGDKYGVKITEVYHEAEPVISDKIAAVNPKENKGISEGENQNKNEEKIDDSDFDLSDYEIEEDV